MRFDRYFPVLAAFWRYLFLVVLLGVGINLLTEALTGGQWRPTAEAIGYVWRHPLPILIPAIVLIALTVLSFFAKRRRLDDELLRDAFVKRGKDLRPGLRAENADVAIPEYRPHVYLEREFDQAALHALSACGGVMLIGRPLSGKSRSALQLLRQFPDVIVVVPRVDKPPLFRSDGLRGQDVVILIDDLHLLAPTLDVTGWMHSVQNAEVRTLRLIATSRDGADWERVEAHQRLLVRRFADGCRIYTSRGSELGADLTVEEGKALATKLRLGLSAGEFEQQFDGTPGSLTLNLAAMGERYKALNRELLDGSLGGRLIDSVKLLHVAGQPRFRDDIVRATAELIRGNRPMSNESWDALKRRTSEEGFGVFVHGEFQTYRPYLERAECVSYVPSEAEIEALFPLLTAHADFIGLYYLAATAREKGNKELAKRAYAASADGGIGQAANNLGTLLMEEESCDQAEIMLKRAIDLGADLAYGNLGKLLSDQTNRLKEAEDAFRAGAAKGAANSSFGLGHHLAKQQGREDEAEAAYREAIARGDRRALLNLGNLLIGMPGRYEDAKELLRDAVKEGVVEANNSLGMLLWQERKRDDAERVFRRAAEADLPESWFNLGELLSEGPDRWVDAEECYQKAIAAGVKEAHYRLGLLLARQVGRELDAAEALNNAVAVGEHDAHHHLGLVLARIPGKETESEAALRHAIDAGDRLAVNSLGVLLADRIGFEVQAEVILNSASVIAPGVANRNLGILLARQEGREEEAENAFRSAIVAGEVQAYLDLGKLLVSIPGRVSDACAALHRVDVTRFPEAKLLLAEHCRGTRQRGQPLQS